MSTTTIPIAELDHVVEPSFASQAKVFVLTTPSTVKGFFSKTWAKIRGAVHSVRAYVHSVVHKLMLRLENWGYRHPTFVHRAKFALTWVGAAIGFGVLMAIYLLTFIMIYIGVLALFGLLV